MWNHERAVGDLYRLQAKYGGLPEGNIGRSLHASPPVDRIGQSTFENVWRTSGCARERYWELGGRAEHEASPWLEAWHLNGGRQLRSTSGSTRNGLSNFTKDLFVAQRYAERRDYGEGVISVTMPKDDYDTKYKMYEEPFSIHSALTVPKVMMVDMNGHPRAWLP